MRIPQAALSLTLSALLLSGCFAPEIELTPKETVTDTVCDTVSESKSDTFADTESSNEPTAPSEESLESSSINTESAYETSSERSTVTSASNITENYVSVADTDSRNIPLTETATESEPATEAYSEKVTSVTVTEAENHVTEYTPEYTNNYHGHVYTGGPYSKKYHYEANCAGKNSHEITWDEVNSRGLGPCGTCVLK